MMHFELTDIKTVMSDKFPAKGGKQPVSFKKLRSSTKVFAIMKMIQSVFLAVLRLYLSGFHRGKILFLPSGPNCQVHKTRVPAVSEMCKY